MNKFLILLEDSSHIQFNQVHLIKKCNTYKSNNYSIYKTSFFIDGTGYMKTVRDEIDFVLQEYKRQGILIFDKEKFIKIWNFEKYLDYDIRQLSGGWRKYLGLALFCNQKAEGRIFFDACRQLSDRLINLFIKALSLVPDETIFFFEYDNRLLSDFNLKELYNSTNEFTESLNEASKTEKFENNYE